MRHFIIVAISVLCFAPSHSLHTTLSSSQSHNHLGKHAGSDDEHEHRVLMHPALVPRDLHQRYSQSARGRDLASENNAVLAAAKTESKVEAKNTETKGETSQYFTMDYSHVKRRRPIHNKSHLPLIAP